jgi:5-methylcytosine-specific restriction endonuclease McrA
VPFLNQEDAQRWRLENREKILAQQRKRRLENPERYRGYRSNREKLRLRDARYRAENPEKVSIIQARSRRRNLDKIHAKAREHRLNNLESVRLKARTYRAENLSAFAAYQRSYLKRNVQARIRSSLKNRLGCALRAQSAKKSAAGTTLLCGISMAELKRYLESQFTNRMSWQNYGVYWHVDHIIPCSLFDLRSGSQQKVCFHWTNLRPLEAHENLRRGNRLEAPAQVRLPL